MTKYDGEEEAVRKPDVLERARSWNRCYPGNLNIEVLVDDLAAEVAHLRQELDGVLKMIGEK